MSKLITVPPPSGAVADASGVGSYRTEIVSLAVAQRGDGTALLSLVIGAEEADLELDAQTRRHLRALLSHADDLNVPCGASA